MFFKKKTPNTNIDDKLSRALAVRDDMLASVADLQAEIGSLIETIHEKDHKIADLEKTIVIQGTRIANLEEIIQEKDKKIRHLEVILRDDEEMIDDSTKLYNRAYYEKHLKGRIGDHFHVLTIRIMHFDADNPLQVRQRLQLSDLVMGFCESHNDIPTLWDDDTIKLFIEVDDSKSHLREEIIRLLKDHVEMGSTLNLSFKAFSHDDDLK